MAKVAIHYAYPCTETHVGGKDYVDSMRKHGTIKYARIGGDANAVITDFIHLDPLLVPSYGLEDHTSADKLIALCEEGTRKRGHGRHYVPWGWWRLYYYLCTGAQGVTCLSERK